MAQQPSKSTPGISRRSAQVPGQFFGYSLQPIRLLSLALDAAPGTMLSLEVFEDVGSRDTSGEAIASQTKSGLGANPVSDRAVDLWKTFSNWLTAVGAGQLVAASTRFEIYLAKRHTGRLVALFDAAKTPEQAEAALEKAREVLWGAGPKYSKRAKLAENIAPFVNHVLDPKSIDAVGIIQHFTLSVASKDPLRDLRPKVNTKWVRPESVELVIQHAHGWIKEKLDGLLLEQKPPVLNVDEFNAEIAAYLPRIDFRQILTAIAGGLNLTETAIAAEQLRTYVRQLELIEYSEEDVIEAINNFLRASAERVAWSKAGIVHDKSFDDYEEGLIAYWKNKRTVHKVTNKTLTDVEQGQLLLADCAMHQQKLQGLEVPTFFTPGSFHALAEERTVGWHPQYETLLVREDKNGDLV